jgi:hypothetical protein
MLESADYSAESGRKESVDVDIRFSNRYRNNARFVAHQIVSKTLDLLGAVPEQRVLDFYVVGCIEELLMNAEEWGDGVTGVELYVAKHAVIKIDQRDPCLGLAQTISCVRWGWRPTDRSGREFDEPNESEDNEANGMLQVHESPLVKVSYEGHSTLIYLNPDKLRLKR